MDKIVEKSKMEEGESELMKWWMTQEPSQIIIKQWSIQIPQELSKAALYNISIILKVQKIIDRLQENNQTKLHLDGLLGSAVSL
jgi:hypothetical protein